MSIQNGIARAPALPFRAGDPIRKSLPARTPISGNYTRFIVWMCLVALAAWTLSATGATPGNGKAETSKAKTVKLENDGGEADKADDGEETGKKKKKKEKADAGAEFFADTEIRTFDFKISEEELAKLQRSSKTYVSAEITEGKNVMTNVGVRLKGMGSFRPINEKPSFAVKFDEFDEKQTYRGLKKLMFNNSSQDSTYVAEMLATQLFADAGVPAARVSHARLRLNGRDLGLYVVIEAMNKDFLKRHFGSGKGNMYEGYLEDINGSLDQDNGEDLSGADLQALNEACAIVDPAERWKRLNEIMDVDRFLSFIAMELLTTHWDGYAIHYNNFRIYHDPKTDKMVFITHGLDWAFRRPNVSIVPPLKSVVTRAVMTTPEGKERFPKRIRSLYTEVFKAPVILDRMEKALERIRRAGLTAAQLALVERRAAIMRERIQMRVTRVDEQLRGIPPESLKFDANNIAYPVTWREDPDVGDGIADRVKHLGKNTLHIQAHPGKTRHSWRSQQCMLPGWYRFEGMACTNLATGGSVRLRISGETRSAGVTGVSGWRPLSHDFYVPEGSLDQELVCELNATQGGDVWFDLDSLRVKRIDAPAGRVTPGTRTIIRQADVPAERPIIRPAPVLQQQ
jgi:spore coat protein H